MKHPTRRAVLRIGLPCVLLAMLPLAAATRSQWSIDKGWPFVGVISFLLAAPLRMPPCAQARDEALRLAVTEGIPDAIQMKDANGR